MRRTNAPKDLVILGDKIKEYFVNQQREKKRGEEQKKEIEKRQRQLEREQQQEEARKLKVLQAEVR